MPVFGEFLCQFLKQRPTRTRHVRKRIYRYVCPLVLVRMPCRHRHRHRGRSTVAIAPDGHEIRPNSSDSPLPLPGCDVPNSAHITSLPPSRPPQDLVHCTRRCYHDVPCVIITLGRERPASLSVSLSLLPRSLPLPLHLEAGRPRGSLSLALAVWG